MMQTEFCSTVAK